jgi:hypothetical protein
MPAPTLTCPYSALRGHVASQRFLPTQNSEEPKFLYVQFWLRPKSEFTTLAVSDAQQVVLELPRKLIEDWKAENPDQSVTDQSIAADIARVVAVDAIFSFPNRLEYEFDEPKWLEQRHPVMNARACDHHDNGIRAWVVKFSDATKVIETSPEAKH